MSDRSLREAIKETAMVLQQMTEYSCAQHVHMASGYLGWHAQADWFKARRYKQRKCGECGLWKIVLAPDGERVIESWWHEEARYQKAAVRDRSTG